MNLRIVIFHKHIVEQKQIELIKYFMGDEYYDWR